MLRGALRDGNPGRAEHIWRLQLLKVNFSPQISHLEDLYLGAGAGMLCGNSGIQRLLVPRDTKLQPGLFPERGRQQQLRAVQEQQRLQGREPRDEPEHGHALPAGHGLSGRGSFGGAVRAQFVPHPLCGRVFLPQTGPVTARPVLQQQRSQNN
ncbi:uncharacterized protein M8220_013004 isoform 2-T2 [Acridotheres tristis]